MSVHRFRPRLPMRALAVGSALEVTGAVLAVALEAATGHVAWVLPGVVLVVLGSVLIAVAILSTVRNAAEVELTDEGYVVRNRAGEQRGSWSEVTSVKQSVEGDRLTFVSGDGSTVHVVAAQGSITSLASEVTTRLNRNRGYGRI
ncbi:hypothetical protein GC722_02165 [Auraticoccus sp. F435]|uniref:PH domain-containing protein n=1 Tax=Auraticoccus cholistanensis TaxID=2656650 RepID=A0A6A9UQ39_9ACTN|nr:anaerobic C4-dicarboxylate transporter family protein [Auraticoccus cholistanensis]MVA74843.1 hypothetical protein [Auraticoccus cholistanensis]